MSNNIPEKMSGVQFVNIVNNALDRRDLSNTQRLKNTIISSDCNLRVKPENNNINKSQAPLLKENLILNINTYNPFYEHCIVVRDASNVFGTDNIGKSYTFIWSSQFSIPKEFYEIKDRISVVFTDGVYDEKGEVGKIKMELYSYDSEKQENVLLLSKEKYGSSISHNFDTIKLTDIMLEDKLNYDFTIKISALEFEDNNGSCYVGPAYCVLKDYQYLDSNRLFNEEAL